MPPEVELARYYGVSRMTVRRAIEALTTEGLLRSRRGAGTFVTENTDPPRYEVDLLLPWREQLLATGHVARSRLIETYRQTSLPEDLELNVHNDAVESYHFGRHLQEVDGTVIAMTESWIPERDPSTVGSQTRQDKGPLPPFSQLPLTSAVSASSTVRIALATAGQAENLDCPADVPLLENTTASRLRRTGQLVELARTSWISNRCRFIYRRRLALGQIDMSELLESD